MKKYFLFVLIYLINISINAQSITNLTVVSGEKRYYIHVYDREGMIYFSIKNFADALSIDYSYNSETEKIQLKFPDNNLYITAKDPFMVLQKKDKSHTDVIQLPTSTYLLENQIYIPLKYSLETLQKASGMNLVFQPPNILIVKTEKPMTNIITDGSASNSSFDITGFSLDEKANGTLVRINSKKRIPSYNSSYKNGILTFIFRKAHVDAAKLYKRNGEGLIKWIQAKNVKSDAEIQFGVGKEYTSNEVLNVNNSNDLLIALYNKVFENHAVKKKEKAKWDFNVIVIDAGHGGKDTGTLGVNGIEEKNINLAIALKLGKDIEQQMKDVKVVYTRKTDKFIELYRRGQIANEAGGNLFISIHCNATPKKPSDANGFEVYLLRPGRTKEAIDIAERENSVIKYEDNPARYKKLTDENFILVSMAQSSYMRYSEKFAEILDKEFSKDIGIEARGVKQAGFYVLVGASMPSVLIETGFLSNRHDALYLNSSKGQAQIAEAILRAIKKFKEVYEQNIEAE
ncbi:MAG: N-acetylmuramoyl-L-alanine amidase [Bacteroidetes bacterium]|nr:N-acetylmuramoyl-L-alanine amidase [Bacteroidota bacterium]